VIEKVLQSHLSRYPSLQMQDLYKLLHQAALGSEVTLWGRGPHETILSIDEVARAAGTIGYELMCALAMRVPASAVE